MASRAFQRQIARLAAKRRRRTARSLRLLAMRYRKLGSQPIDHLCASTSMGYRSGDATTDLSEIDPRAYPVNAIDRFSSNHQTGAGTRLCRHF